MSDSRDKLLQDKIDPLGRTLFEERDSAGDIHLQVAPGQEVCDFCLIPDPTWEYPCGKTTLPGNAYFDASDDEWAACDTCHHLIETEDINALVTHMVATQRKQPLQPGWIVPPLPDQLDKARISVEAFLTARQGPAKPFNSK